MQPRAASAACGHTGFWKRGAQEDDVGGHRCRPKRQTEIEEGCIDDEVWHACMSTVSFARGRISKPYPKETPQQHAPCFSLCHWSLLARLKAGENRVYIRPLKHRMATPTRTPAPPVCRHFSAQQGGWAAPMRRLGRAAAGWCWLRHLCSWAGGSCAAQGCQQAAADPNGGMLLDPWHHAQHARRSARPAQPLTAMHA